LPAAKLLKPLSRYNLSGVAGGTSRGTSAFKVCGCTAKADIEPPPSAGEAGSELASAAKGQVMAIAKNTICLWYDKDAEAAARFYAETFPNSSVSAVHRAPSDNPSGKA